MSLVGTRPPTLDEWDKYELHHRATLRISLSWIGNLMILYNFHMFYKDTKDKQTNKVRIKTV